MICFIIYYAIVFFANNAFHIGLVTVGLSAYYMHEFLYLDGRCNMDFSFKSDIFDILIFCRHKRGFNKVIINFYKAFLLYR